MVLNRVFGSSSVCKLNSSNRFNSEGNCRSLSQFGRKCGATWSIARIMLFIS